jgi:hypothetical protein
MNGSPSATVYEPTSESPQGPLTRAVFLLFAGPGHGFKSHPGASVRVVAGGTDHGLGLPARASHSRRAGLAAVG